MCIVFPLTPHLVTYSTLDPAHARGRGTPPGHQAPGLAQAVHAEHRILHTYLPSGLISGRYLGSAATAHCTLQSRNPLHVARN